MTVACTIAAVCILIAGLFAVIVERTTERDEARAEVDRLSRELEAARKSRLRVVPPQRDGSEHEWPRMVRQIEHDDMTALMRATEEK